MPTDFVNGSTGLMEGISTWAYNVTDGIFFSVLLLGFCIVLGISSIKSGIERAVGYAGVTGLFGAIILVTLGLMPWWIASLFILVGAGGIAFMIVNR